MGNAGAVSSPRRAALQGLQKMRLLHDLGCRQGLLPPQWRPDRSVLQALGYEPGTSLAEALAAPRPLFDGLVPLLCSASSMWAANAATVSPSADTADARVHLTPANLSSTTHRSFESAQTTAILRAIFADQTHFRVHEPLPAAAAFADEGAANHGRFTQANGQPGIQLFVYGREADEPIATDGYPRRQTRLAGELIAASHGLAPDRIIYAKQSPEAIDAGAFHNDVVSVVNGDVMFAHERAFDNPGQLRASLDDRLGGAVRYVEVPDHQVPLADAVSSYLFNSQLVSLPRNTSTSPSGGGPSRPIMALIAPREVDEIPSTAAYLRDALGDVANPIGELHTLDLRESMRNGGGPACLRLRVVLTDDEVAALGARVIVDDPLLDELEAWVERNYRDELAPADLVDPNLETESADALDELTAILGLGNLYEFQR